MKLCLHDHYIEGLGHYHCLLRDGHPGAHACYNDAGHHSPDYVPRKDTP